MLCGNDEISPKLNASAELPRKNRRRRWYGILAVFLCGLLLAWHPEGKARQSLHLSGGIIAEEPAKPEQKAGSASQSTKSNAPGNVPKTDAKSRDAAPPSSRQAADAPLQAAPVIEEPDSRPSENPAEDDAKQEPEGKSDRPKPRTNRTPAQAPSGLRLFGTVEFKGPLKSMAQWQSVLQRNEKQSIFSPEKKLGSAVWRDLKAKFEKLSPMEQLQAVNRFWNQWPYRQDPEVYKKADYWAIPAEFVKNSGDCEDYAISKYFTLKELGVDPKTMRIVVLMETIRNIAHAVLVVYMDGDAFVLDNLSNNVLSHSRYRNYLPQFSVNESFRWAHVRPK